MRLLYFTRALSGHDARFLRGFHRENLEVALLTLRGFENAGHRLPPGLVSLGHLKMPMCPRAAHFAKAIKAFRSRVKRFAPTIILVGPLTDCAYVATKARVGCPCVVQSWAFDVFWEVERDGAAARRARFALRHATALFADCQAVVERCAQLAGKPARRHFVMPWGLDQIPVSQLPSRQRVRQRLRLARRKVFLHTRGLDPIYGTETLLEAIRQVCRKRLDATFLLASDGPLRPLAERFITRHSLGRQIKLLGGLSHTKVLELFRAADIYVSASASDGSSISLLEAMALGVPPIVSDRGGSREWVTHRDDGWLVPFGDADRLASAMIAAAMLKPQQRRRMVRANLRRVEQAANWSRNLRRFGKFLAESATWEPDDPELNAGGVTPRAKI
jgi:L-malate glycosyltransferase